MYIIKCPDRSRWKVRKAVSLKAAINEIAMARACGSVGSSSVVSEWRSGELTDTKTIADVIQINSDGTERQPYTEVY